MFVYFSGLTSVPSNIPFDTRMVDLQNNKIKEIKENDFRGLTSLYVRLYTLIFKYLVKILITVRMITYIASIKKSYFPMNDPLQSSCIQSSKHYSLIQLMPTE